MKSLSIILNKPVRELLEEAGINYDKQEKFYKDQIKMKAKMDKLSKTLK